AVRGELLEVRAEFEAPEDGDVRFDVRGIPVAYLAKSREIEVNGHKAPAPTRDGKVRLALYTDRTSIEVFVGDGLTYVPMPVIAKPEALTVSVRREGEPVRFTTLDVHALKSIWGGRSAR
ncbi:GH32 C-terminal domain-containing protein, partial [Singulisphaera rosea]